MKRADYIFTIGFDGGHAIVDKRSRSRYGRLDTRALADQGQFRAACRSALFEGRQQNAGYVLEKFNAVSLVRCSDSAALERMFGIQPPSAEISGIRVV